MLSLDQCLLIEMHVFEVANASLIVLSLKNVLMIETLSQVCHALKCCFNTASCKTAL